MRQISIPSPNDHVLSLTNENHLILSCLDKPKHVRSVKHDTTSSLKNGCYIVPGKLFEQIKAIYFSCHFLSHERNFENVYTAQGKPCLSNYETRVHV